MIPATALDGWALVIGVDPGPVPGLTALLIRNGKVCDVEIVQMTADFMPKALKALVVPRAPHGPVLIGVERFVVGPRASRSSTPKAGAITRDMVGEVTAVGQELGATVVQATASQALTWSSDERLEKAGIVVPKGMAHARAAARHALYTAVKHGHLPDPLSKTNR